MAAVPPGSVTISNAKAAALREIQSAMDAVKQAQQSGNFGDYGQALQRLNDAMTKYDNAGRSRACRYAAPVEICTNVHVPALAGTGP